MGNTVIELKSLSRSYGYGEGTTYALKDFDLTVKRGEFIMIMGPSGCGKTTLLNILGLLDKPTDGTYLLNSKPIEKISPRRKARIRSDKIGMIFQSFNLIPTMQVIDNVALQITYCRFRIDCFGLVYNYCIADGIAVFLNIICIYNKKFIWNNFV